MRSRSRLSLSRSFQANAIGQHKADPTVARAIEAQYFRPRIILAVSARHRYAGEELWAPLSGGLSLWTAECHRRIGRDSGMIERRRSIRPNAAPHHRLSTLPPGCGYLRSTPRCARLSWAALRSAAAAEERSKAMNDLDVAP